MPARSAAGTAPELPPTRRVVAAPAGDGTRRAPYSEFRYDMPDDRHTGLGLSETTATTAAAMTVAARDWAALRLRGDGLAARRGGRLILQDLSFSVGSGELLALVGPNGAGKSTTLRLIAGLIRPAAGTITLDPSPDEDIGSQVHYLGHLDALKPALSLADNLIFWRRLRRGQGLDVEAALDQVDLGDLIDLPAGVLSAGQKRRAAIARLLLDRRPIWLLDEPTSALDADSEAMLGGLIGDHLAGGGMAVVATHRPLPVAATATLTLGRRA